jgi:hypothetical protein
MKKTGWILLMVLPFFSTPVFSEMAVSLQKGTNNPASGPEKIRSASQEQSLSDVNLSFLKQRKGSMDWGRDPFVLPARPAGEPQQVMNGMEKPFSLSAIIYNSGAGTAIINGRIVRKGDQIEGMEVSEVHSDRVLLKEGLRNLELRVDPFLSK